MSSLSSDAERGGAAGVGRRRRLGMALTQLAKGASTQANMKPRQCTRPLAAADLMSELRNDPRGGVLLVAIPAVAENSQLKAPSARTESFRSSEVDSAIGEPT
jgi:hypothetical protein